jgi:GNAT superfamily N-acetyltransferase
LSELQFRPMAAEEGDLRRFASCFESNGDPKDLKVLRWQYLGNPVGQVYVDFATDESESAPLGGIYATFPVEMQLGDHRVVGVQSLDTLTDANHRGKGLFTKLAAAVYERCRQSGVALVYGFPNESSAPGFFGKLSWTRLDPVPFLFLPLRARFFLRHLGVPGALARLVPDRLPRRAPSPAPTADEEVAVVDRLGPEVDGLWERFSQHVKISVVRDRRYLSWRLARPGGGYKIHVFRRAGELRGLAITALKSKHGGQVGYVMDVLHVPDDLRAGEILMRSAVDDLAASGADVVLGWCLEHSPNRTTYRKAGFRHLPQSVRPIQLHFGARALDAPPDAAVANRRNWYLSYLDSDTV